MVVETVAGSLRTFGALAKAAAPVLAFDPCREVEGIVWKVVNWLTVIGVWY